MPVKLLAEDFARYVYLLRLKNSAILNRPAHPQTGSDHPRTWTHPTRSNPRHWHNAPPPPPPVSTQPNRFHGTVTINTLRVGADAGKIAEEVIAHLSSLVGAKVTITLEIETEIPSGVPGQVVRTVTENSRTLKFSSQGFEKE